MSVENEQCIGNSLHDWATVSFDGTLVCSRCGTGRRRLSNSDYATKVFSESDAEGNRWIGDQQGRIRRMEKWRYAAKILVLLGAVSLVASIVAFLQGTTSSAANPYAPPFPTIPALLFVLFMVLTLSSIVVRATAGKSIAEAWLAISSAIRDQCPLCKKLNARQLVGGELTKQYDDQGTVVDKAVAEATHRVPSKDAKTGHEFNYRCRFCHSSWTVPTRSSAENRTQR